MIIVSVNNIFFLGLYPNMILVFCIYHLFFCIVLPLVLYFFFYKNYFSSFQSFLGFIKPINKSYIYYSISIGFIFLLFTILISIKIPQIKSIIRIFEKSNFVLLAASYALIANPLLEEIFWRGFIYSVSKNINKSILMVFNSILFSLFHFFLLYHFSYSFLISFIITLVILVFGFIVNIFRIKSNSIIPSVILHYLVSIGYTISYLFLLYK
jgi:uncharacterized protein